MSIAPTFHPKGWGHELWIHNDEMYCGKLLAFDAGKHCSFHFHRVKHETFYLERGHLDVFACEQHELNQFMLREGSMAKLHAYIDAFVNFGTIPPQPFVVTHLHPGCSFEVPRGLAHMMVARESSHLFEFSTQHFDDDSYRVVKGC